MKALWVIYVEVAAMEVRVVIKDCLQSMGTFPCLSLMNGW